MRTGIVLRTRDEICVEILENLLEITWDHDPDCDCVYCDLEKSVSKIRYHDKLIELNK